QIQFTWSGTNNLLHSPAHGLKSGQTCQVVTNGTLPGGYSSPVTFSSINSSFTVTGSLPTLDRYCWFSTTGSMPGGLNANYMYFPQFGVNLARGRGGGSPVTLTSNGSNCTIHDSLQVGCYYW